MRMVLMRVKEKGGSKQQIPDHRRQFLWLRVVVALQQMIHSTQEAPYSWRLEITPQRVLWSVCLDFQYGIVRETHEEE